MTMTVSLSLSLSVPRVRLQVQFRRVFELVVRRTSEIPGKSPASERNPREKHLTKEYPLLCLSLKGVHVLLLHLPHFSIHYYSLLLLIAWTEQAYGETSHHHHHHHLLSLSLSLLSLISLLQLLRDQNHRLNGERKKGQSESERKRQRSQRRERKRVTPSPATLPQENQLHHLHLQNQPKTFS